VNVVFPPRAAVCLSHGFGGEENMLSLIITGAVRRIQTAKGPRQNSGLKVKRTSFVFRREKEGDDLSNLFLNSIKLYKF